MNTINTTDIPHTNRDNNLVTAIINIVQPYGWNVKANPAAIELSSSDNKTKVYLKINKNLVYVIDEEGRKLMTSNPYMVAGTENTTKQYYLTSTIDKLIKQFYNGKVIN